MFQSFYPDEIQESTYEIDFEELYKKGSFTCAHSHDE